MRRGTLFIVDTFELLLFFQVGLPAIIHKMESDTKPPSNLFDTDFDENCKALPSSWPPTDPVPMFYYYYKSWLAEIFRRFFQHALSLRAQSYAVTMKLEGELHETDTDAPHGLQMRP